MRKSSWNHIAWSRLAPWNSPSCQLIPCGRDAVGKRFGGQRRDLDSRELAHGLRQRCGRVGLEKGKAPGTPEAFLQATLATPAYLSEVLIEVNLLFRFVPRPLTTAAWSILSR